MCVCVSVGERAGEGGREQITNKVRVERSAVQCLHNELMRTDELQTSPVTAGGDVGTQSTLRSGCGCGCGSWRHVGYCAVRLVRYEMCVCVCVCVLLCGWLDMRCVCVCVDVCVCVAVWLVRD